MSNQIDHSRFKSYLLNVRNKDGADIGLERHHHLMIVYVRLGVASATFRKVGELRPLDFNTSDFMIQLSLDSGRVIFLIGQ